MSGQREAGTAGEDEESVRHPHGPLQESEVRGAGEVRGGPPEAVREGGGNLRAGLLRLQKVPEPDTSEPEPQSRQRERDVQAEQLLPS